MLNGRIKKRRSIKYKFAILCVGLLTFTILVCWMINNIFLDKYYQINKVNAIKGIYTMITTALEERTIQNPDFQNRIKELTDEENISLFVLDDGMNIVISTENEQFVSLLQVREAIYDMYGDTYGSTTKNTEVLEEGKTYTIVKTTDVRFSKNYIQLGAVLTSNYFLVMRSPMQSFKQTASITNRFLAFIGIVLILFSGFMAWVISDRITSPIRRLVEISDKMAALDFDARYDGEDDTEIGILGDHMNFLSETLEKSIGELKTANRELQIEVEKKTKIDEVRKDFLSNVSHELKTPIALIQGYAEGLKECVNDDEESKNFYCDVIMDEAQKMNILVRKLLTLNKIEFGDSSTTTMERVDLSELLDNVITSVTLLAEQKEAQIIRHYEPHIFVWGNEFEIQQIVTNYLSNAINHVTGENKIDVRAYKREKDIYISVFNTGYPIPEEELDNIWQKFYKVDKAHSRDYGGTGIGLSIVKAIITSLGQECGVKNYDNGVEFWFTLDAKIKNEQQGETDGSNHE